MRNPTRRSRNIGTARQGHGQNNRLVLPSRTHPNWLRFFENLSDFTTQTRVFGENTLTFLIEKPRRPCVHACSIDDITRVLSFVPAQDLDGLKFIVLRQPKRKEEILSLVWGRYTCCFEFKNEFESAIILETMDLTRVLRWKKPLCACDVKELNLLRAENHLISETAKHFEIRSTLESVRQTQLLRTLPHEIGHHVHWKRDESFNQLPKREKEKFAEKYAREWLKKFASGFDILPGA